MSGASIIIPAYNQARYLSAAVESALAQTFQPLEVIVVNDGSTDDIEAALEPYRQRITFLSQENQGLSAARNTGYQASRGDWILFLDGDDTIAPDMVARLVDLLQYNPAFGLAYCAWNQVSAEEALRLGTVRPGYSGKLLEPLLLRRFFFFASGALIRRSALEQVGLFDSRLPWGEDGDLWLRLAAGGYQFGYLDEVLLNYRVHPHSMTAQVGPLQIRGWLAVLEKFFSRPDLPSKITALKGEAYSVLYFETAGRYFRSGLAAEGADCMHAGAQALGRPLDPDWFLEWLAGTALDPRTPEPDAFIKLVFNSLPDELAELRFLRRKAAGRYHTALVFSALAGRDYQKARGHWLPAAWYDPAVLLNRGFLRAAYRIIRQR